LKNRRIRHTSQLADNSAKLVGFYKSNQRSSQIGTCPNSGRRGRLENEASSVFAQPVEVAEPAHDPHSVPWMRQKHGDHATGARLPRLRTEWKTENAGETPVYNCRGTVWGRPGSRDSVVLSQVQFWTRLATFDAECRKRQSKGCGFDCLLPAGETRESFWLKNSTEGT